MARLILYDDNSMVCRVLVTDADDVPATADTVSVRLLNFDTEEEITDFGDLEATDGLPDYNWQGTLEPAAYVEVPDKVLLEVTSIRGEFTNVATPTVRVLRYKGEQQ